MANDVSLLFEPLTIRGKTLRNRLVMPPMVVNRGHTGPEALEWYGGHARGGVGLVIVEATNLPDFGDPLSADALRPLVGAIHAGGALAAIQVFPWRRGVAITPAELSLAGIGQIVQGYRRAAQICAEAGFDGIEPHGAHGFLLNQFFSPEKNLRRDAYGGDRFAGRARLALEIVGHIYPIARSAGMWVLYRHTPVGPGYDLQESVALAESLLAAGVDILDISPASKDAPADRAAPFMRLGAPVIGVNQLDQVDRAVEALREGRCSLVAVGRGLIADPEWPIKVREGRGSEIKTCSACDQCHAMLNRGEVVRCAQW